MNKKLEKKEILEKLENMIADGDCYNEFFTTNISAVCHTLDEANDNLGITSPKIRFFYQNYPEIYDYWNSHYDLKDVYEI